MAKKIFINLPVKDLKKSVDFFTKLGFTFNAQFTDENATAMVVDENITVMLLIEKFFGTFIDKPISDAKKATEVMLSISADSRASVDDTIDKAVKAGGKSPRQPADHGWMYYRSFEDLDGHHWEFAFIDESAIPQG
jgi:predicted lactoylglutathione lyase